MIHLADCAHIPAAIPRHAYPAELLAQGRAALVKAGLRFDPRTGRLRDNSGELERYSRQSDYAPHESLDDVTRWEFSRHIANAASRLSRGYPAH